jgi:hypothetical protein
MVSKIAIFDIIFDSSLWKRKVKFCKALNLVVI